MDRNARRLAGPGLGLRPGALHASGPAALNDDSAGFSLHLESLFLNDRKDGEDNIGSGKVLPTRADDHRRQSKSGRERGASFIGSVIAKAISLTDVVGRCLLCSEVGFNPTNGVGPEKQSPKVAVDAVKESGGREPPRTAGNATNEVLRVND